MKLELPLVLGLLACGCWLFLWPRPQAPEPQLRQEKTGAIVDPAVRLAAAQEEQVESISELIPREDESTPQPPPRRASLDFSGLDGPTLLNKAADNIANGPTVRAKNRLRVSMFGQSIVATGNCFFSGQGEGKSRFDFNIQRDSVQINLQQVCDGRHYLLTATRGQNEPAYTYIDLERVASSPAANSIYEGPPTQWLGIGGVGGMLQQLAKDFEFGPVQQVDLGGLPMLRIRGEWKPERLRQLLAGTVDPRWLGETIAWEHLPPQIPREVVVNLGMDDFLPLFPYRIEFDAPESQDLPIDSRRDGPMVRFEMYEVIKGAQFDSKLFSLDLQGKSYVDLTSVYVGRLQELESIEKTDSTTR